MSEPNDPRRSAYESLDPDSIKRAAPPKVKPPEPPTSQPEVQAAKPTPTEKPIPKIHRPSVPMPQLVDFSRMTTSLNNWRNSWPKVEIDPSVIPIPGFIKAIPHVRKRYVVGTVLFVAGVAYFSLTKPSTTARDEFAASQRALTPTIDIALTVTPTVTPTESGVKEPPPGAFGPQSTPRPTEAPTSAPTRIPTPTFDPYKFTTPLARPSATAQVETSSGSETNAEESEQTPTPTRIPPPPQRITNPPVVSVQGPSQSEILARQQLIAQATQIALMQQIVELQNQLTPTPTLGAETIEAQPAEPTANELPTTVLEPVSPETLAQPNTREESNQAVGSIDGCLPGDGSSNGVAITVGLYNDGQYDELTLIKEDEPDNPLSKNISDNPTSPDFSELQGPDGSHPALKPGIYDIIITDFKTGAQISSTGLAINYCPPPVPLPPEPINTPPTQAPANTATAEPVKLKYPEPPITVGQSKKQDSQYVPSGPDRIQLYRDPRCDFSEEQSYEWNKWVKVNLPYLRLYDPRFTLWNDGDSGMLGTALDMPLPKHDAMGMTDDVVPQIALKFNINDLLAQCKRLFPIS